MIEAYICLSEKDEILDLHNFVSCPSVGDQIEVVQGNSVNIYKVTDIRHKPMRIGHYLQMEAPSIILYVDFSFALSAVKTIA